LIALDIFTGNWRKLNGVYQTRGAQMTNYKNILVPVELGKHPHEAIEEACSLCLRYSARLCLMTVVQDLVSQVTAAPPEAFVGHFNLEAYRRELKQTAHNALEQIIAESVPAGVDVYSVVAVGDPVTEISRVAQEEGSDLLVLATHGRKGLKRLFMGSVTEKVLRHIDLPILTVHIETPTATETVRSSD
jgi:nucleotide-binding universal stress UspA family protein